MCRQRLGHQIHGFAQVRCNIDRKQHCSQFAKVVGPYCNVQPSQELRRYPNHSHVIVCRTFPLIEDLP